MGESTGNVIERIARAHPDAPAVHAPGHPTLDFHSLQKLIEETRAYLNNHGVGRGDRVALILSSPSVALVAILSTLCSAVAVPVNPKLTKAEIETQLKETRVVAAIVSDDLEDIISLVGQLSIPCFQATSGDDGPAGSFVLSGGSEGAAKVPGQAKAGDIACINTSSGTTGKAKTMLVSHETLLRRARCDGSILHLTPADVLINFRPPYLTGPQEIGFYTPIVAGSSVLVPPVFDADMFFRDIVQYGVTWYTGGPAFHRAIIERAPDHRAEIEACRLRLVRSAGYALSEELQAALEDTFGVPCVQKYGGSESGLVSCNPLPPGLRKPGTSGPVVGGEVRIVDGKGNTLPEGVTGEIIVRGPLVFNGYDDEEMNRAAFLDGWFRTGDLGSLDPDGYLSITGRRNEIINRGGQKISPQEVETAFLAMPGVSRAICFPIPHATLGTTAGLAVVPEPGETLDPETLRNFATRRLARFKIPETILTVGDIPLGPGGKPLRNGAAQFFGLDGTTEEDQEETRVPKDALEEIWCSVLRLEGVSETQNFTRAGGDSLSAMRLLLRIEEAFKVQLPDDIVFGDGATLEGLRRSIDSASGQIAADESRRVVPMRRTDLTAAVPLTTSQMRMWSICKLFPESPIYNISFGVRFFGSYDILSMQQAVNQVITRHEALRAVFPEKNGVPQQVFLPRLDAPLAVTDLRDLPEETREVEYYKLAREATAAVFDLANGPLVRAHLYILDEKCSVLIFQCHHIIGDAISAGILAQDLAVLYEASRSETPIDLPVLDCNFGDLVASQAEQLTESRRKELLDYWIEELKGAPTEIELPAGCPKSGERHYQGERYRVSLSKELANGLRILAADCNASLFSTALAAFQLMVARLTGNTDFIVGTGIDTRPPEYKDKVVGFFVNTVPLHAHVKGDTLLTDHVVGIQKCVMRALRHSDVPFEEIVQRLSPARRDVAPPLVQLFFGFLPSEPSKDEFPSSQLENYYFDQKTARFDLCFMLEETEEGIGGFVEYTTDFFDRESIQLLADRFETVLSAITADPSRRLWDYPVISNAEKKMIAEYSTGPKTPYPEKKSVPEIFVETVQSRASAIAMVQGGRQISYQELDDWSDRIAGQLLDRGVERGAIIALSAERTPAAIAGLLAILKAGAAYVALEPNLPQARVSYILEDCRTKIVLLQENSTLFIPKDVKVIELGEKEDKVTSHSRPLDVEDLDGRDLAYVTYTSGSLGTPKGVEIEHRSILRLVKGANYAELGTDERIPLTSSLGFDASTFEIWGPLLNGGQIVLPETVFPSISELAEMIIDQKVTTMWLTAGLFRQMVDHRPDCFRNVRQLLAGGDIVSADHVRTLLDQAPGCQPINGYGPTENTTFSTYCRLDRDLIAAGIVPIGKPIANSTAYILDEERNIVPLGVEGDLYVGGDGVARGYLNQPELTDRVFMPDPFSDEPGARMYRTGDRARLMPDGNIHFLGRQDSQVKIRGFRVEIEEIESVLRRLPEVRDAVVLPRRENGVVTRLVAFLIPEVAGEVDFTRIRESLAAKLPAYMVPTEHFFLEEFPLNASGKVDGRRLLELGAAEAEELPKVLPRTPVEELLAEFWSDLLKRDGIGIDEDFFEIGGHSLLVMQLSFRIEEATGLAIDQIDFFTHPTIRRLAVVLVEKLMQAEESGSVADPAVS